MWFDIFVEFVGNWPGTVTQYQQIGNPHSFKKITQNHK